ncbi:MAG: toll/interleukin-1 receptor domain-containing protein [Acidobacteriota bacterium]|nr:MAG: toll/interleukin-1 receptor domain-containing protein [Acidobacteriota bacterium]
MRIETLKQIPGDEQMADQQTFLHFNGVNGATGEYGLPPMTGEELAGFIKGESAPENLAELKFRRQQASQSHYGVKEGVDPKKLDQAGWGVIFAHDAAPEIKEALKPLLDLRRTQAGEKFRCYEGGNGYRVGKDSKNSFLARHGAGPGPADPDKVPYYLLIVGGPDVIPYRFQSQLDVQYAVGRIYFETAGEYAVYAQSVIAAETGRLKLARRLSFFGVANPDDPATTSSEQTLISPLFTKFKGRPGWQVEAFVKDQATKSKLADLLSGAPALLFTASHGMEFPIGHAQQFPHQGALLCGDWPGPKNFRGAIPQDFFFAGDDLASNARLAGLVSFHFACYGAGTPELDEFAQQAFKGRQAIAPKAFLSGLPMRMLSHPKGGALAVIGHVDRAWSTSFVWSGAGAQTTVFESTLQRLIEGHPVGSALEYFNERYAELSTVLTDELEEIQYGKIVDPYELAGMWTANNDARGYTVLGDPAVRMPLAAEGETAQERPEIEIIKITNAPPPAPPPPSPPSEPPPAPPVDQGATSFSVQSSDGDDVLFSAWHPRAVNPGEWHKLLVYAHLQEALDAVKTDAGQVLGLKAADYRQSDAKATAKIANGTEITLVPQADGLEFKPAQATISWSGAWQRADFEMTATGKRAGHVVTSSIACYVGPLMIAEVRLPVVVKRSGDEGTAEEGAQAVESAKMYQAVFASYSHDDTQVVEAVESAYKALGMEYLRDVTTLRSGQKWSDQLLKMIEEADIFQLFWSDKSSRSAYCEQEWQYALSISERKGPGFIRPVYWQKPIPKVPKDLRALHFAPVDFSRFVAPASEPVQQTQSTEFDEKLTSLTVSTWATSDPANPENRRLIARSRIALDGDMENFALENLTSEDEKYLDLHQKMVREAQAARVAYLEVLTKKG